MKILITGIAGFLGKNLISIFEENELLGIDINDAIINDIVVVSSTKINEINFEPDVVVMCHASVVSGNHQIENSILYKVNVELTEIICKKFRNAFLVYISTTSVYNNYENCITEKATINPQSDYAISKFWGEKIALKHNAAIIRLSSLYGEGMKENTLIPNYINQALQNNKIQVWGKGERLQNYVHVSDVSGYIKAIIDNKETTKSKIFLGIATTENSNIEIANFVAQTTNSTVEFINEDTSRSLQYSNIATLQELNYTPQISIETGIKSYINWKRKQF